MPLVAQSAIHDKNKIRHTKLKPNKIIFFLNYGFCSLVSS